MAGINKVILVGNLGKDPEVRHLPSGSSVASFPLATTESFKDKNGNKVDQTEWHNIEVWDGLAKIAEQYLKKGMTIYVEGKIRTENWDDKDGNKRYTTKIRAINFQMLGGRPNEGGTGSYNNAGGQGSAPMTEQPIVVSGGAEDDLPF